MSEAPLINRTRPDHTRCDFMCVYPSLDAARPIRLAHRAQVIHRFVGHDEGRVCRPLPLELVLQLHCCVVDRTSTQRPRLSSSASSVTIRPASSVVVPNATLS